VQETREKNETTADGSATDLLIGESKRVLRGEEDVVGAVEQDDVDDGGAEEQRREKDGGNLVFDEQRFDAYVTASETEGDDHGAEPRYPPAYQQRGLVVAEGPRWRRGRVERHDYLAVARLGDHGMTDLMPTVMKTLWVVTRAPS
jgi:hypothetical protein